MLSQVQTLNQTFNFDWNDYRTIESSKEKIDSIEDAIKKTEENENLALGQLCYKLGTFYNHIKRTPAPALKHLLIAEQLLTGKELAWTQNHIAYSCQQMLAAAKKEKDVEKIEENKIQAIKYCNQIIKQYESGPDLESIKITAFSYCVRALAEFESDQLDIAVKTYRFALDLYEKNGLLDDQYARAKNRYAKFLAEQKNYIDANKAFEELEKYWSEKQDNLYQYPARFYDSYADYLFKMEDDNLVLFALEKYKKAYEILRLTDGEQSPFAKDIFKKISEIQEKSGINKVDEIHASKEKQAEMPLKIYSHFKPASTVKIDQSTITAGFTAKK